MWLIYPRPPQNWLPVCSSSLAAWKQWLLFLLFKQRSSFSVCFKKKNIRKACVGGRRNNKKCFRPWGTPVPQIPRHMPKLKFKGTFIIVWHIPDTRWKQGRVEAVEFWSTVEEAAPKTLLFLVPELPGAANNAVFVYCWLWFKEMRRSKSSDFCQGACR